MQSIITRITRYFALICALGLSAGAWANPWLLSYKSFDNIASSGGVSLTREAGSVDFIKIDGDHINYTTPANTNAKFGARAYQANNGTIGLRNNTSGLVSVADGWTLSFWFHPNNQSNWNSFFGFGLFNGDNYHFLKTDADAFSVYKDTTSTDANALGTPALRNVAYTAASWNHVVLACAAGTGTVTLYVNGVSRGTFTVDSTTSLREVLLCRGRWHSGFDSAFYRNKQTTRFDDFALFNGVLSDTMIATIAAGRSTVADIFNDYEANKTISISGDTTFTVDNDMAFETITVENTSEEAATLTFTGSYVINATQINVPANVTVKVDSAVSGTPVLNAPVVLSDATATLEIAAPATISKKISGSGGVVVSANAVVFTVKNIFTGGLTVKSGGLAKTTVAAATGGGFGGTGSNPQTGSITVEDGGAVDLANCYSQACYALTLAGTGINNSGAAFCSEAISNPESQRQTTSITLTANATVVCDNVWGLLANSYGSTTLSLGTYTLTKKGSANFIVCNTTFSGAGSFVIAEGALKTASNKGSAWASPYDGTLQVNDGASFLVTGAGFGYMRNITCDAGGTVTVANGYTLTTWNGGTTTINGTLDVAGTVKIGYSASANLVVSDSVNMTGTGTLELYSGSTITKTANSSGVINIGSDATVKWINCAWTATAGDIFRGEGTLFLDGRSSNSRIEHKPGQVVFGGILKIGTKTHDANTNYDNHISAYFSESLSNFTGTPTLQLTGATDDADGQLRFGQTGKNTTLSVKNLSGSAEIYPWSSVAGNWNIKTLQTTDTTFSGAFLKYNSGESAANSTLEVYGGEDVHSITLSGASVTEGTATVRDNAKLIFSSTGSWANGKVAVADGGYLEVNNTGTVASTLDLQSGGTIVIQTVTTTSGEGDAATTTTSVVPVSAGAVTFPDSGKAFIDISLIPDLETDESVTLISATTIDSDIANIRPVGKPYALKVEGNELKVVNDGGLVWDSTNGWNGKDVTKYGEATITSPGTVALDGASLAFDTLTLAGSGTVFFSRTGDETITVNNIVIGSGVTLDASAALDLTGATITGNGTLNIPAGTTYSMDGVNCSAKITCAGTLETSGATTLSSTATTISGTIDVLSGTTTLATAKCGITGTVTIEPEASLSSPTWDALDYNGTTTLNVYGTINLQDVWSFASGNTLNFYNGCTITDAGNSHIASYDLVGGPIYVKPGQDGATGTVDLSAVSRLRANTVVNVAEGMTFTVSGQLNSANDGTGFGFTKQGSGIFNLTPSSMSTFTGTTTVSAGQMVMTSFPNFTTVSIADGATFTLKNANWTGTADIFSGNGTLELYANTSGFSQYASTSSFAGKLKVIGNNSKIPYFNGTAPQFTAKPDLELDGSMTLTDQFCGSDKKFTVKNLTCTTSGRIDPYYTNTADARYVSTLQTRDTVCAAVFVSNNSAIERKTGLYVYGQDATVHSLTLTGANTTRGPLEVDTYGKVVFSSTGYWYGPVTIGNNGYLQSDSTATTVAGTLTLQDGATVVRGSQPVKATALAALDANATIKIAFADGVTLADGMVVLSGTWEDTPPDAARFAFADSTLAGEWILTMSANGLSIAAAAAKVTPTTGNPVPYASVDAARKAFATLIGTDEGATLTILDGTTLSEQDMSQLAQDNIYYDSSSGTLTKAVAKVGQTCYPSLSAAISDGAAVTLLRESSEAITLNVAITLTETAAYSGTLSGSGTLTLSALRSSALTFDNWTGTVVLPSFTADGTILNKYGVTGSTVVLKGITSGSLGEASSQKMDVAPTLQLDGDVTITSFSTSCDYTFAEITGTGTFSLAPTGDHPKSVSITKVAEGFTGSISSTINTTLTIGTLDREAGTTVTPGTKVLSTSSGVQASALTVGGEATGIIPVFDTDGLYVKAASVTKNDTTTYHDTVAAALTAAGSGDATITLLADVSLTERLFVNAGATPEYGGSNNRYATTSDNKSLTLNLNGKSITSDSNIALAGGSLTITGKGTISTKNSGLAPIEVRGTGNLASKRTLTIGSGVTLGVEGACYGLNIFGSNDAQKNVIDVTVDGTIKGMLFVLGNLTNPENQINIVVNGTVDASSAKGEENVHTGIALNGNASVTVNDNAVVKGESGIEVRSGTLTVNGGTITATAESYSYVANTSGTTTKGAAIAIAQYGSAQISATLNDGTLVGVKKLGVTDVSGNMSEVTVTAKSNSIDAPTGYKWVESGTPGTYVLVRIKGFKFLVF